MRERMIQLPQFTPDSASVARWIFMRTLAAWRGRDGDSVVAEISRRKVRAGQ